MATGISSVDSAIISRAKRGLIKLAAARSPEAMRNHIEFLSAWT